MLKRRIRLWLLPPNRLVLGFKRLTADNWIDPDPVNRHFARISPIAGPVSMEGGVWARKFLAVSVADHVPGEVADPVETAARIRYAELEGGAMRSSFKETITHLLERGVIAADQLERWEAARQLRNYSSHPRNATVTTPGSVLGTLTLSERADPPNSIHPAGSANRGSSRPMGAAGFEPATSRV
jgi:hypothetical protein